MIPIAAIWVIGLLPFLAFIALVLAQAKFINHVKINRLHLHNNEKMLQRVILNQNLYKYWKMRFVIFTIITVIIASLTVAYTPIAFIFVAQIFQEVNKDNDQIAKITQTGVAVVLWLLDVFFTGLLIWTIYREIYAWNKEMNAWNLAENPEAKTFYEYLKDCESKKEFPAKVKTNKIHFFNRKTTLAYETCNLEKLANSKHKPEYIEGKLLFDTFVDYSQILIEERTVEETDFVAKLLNLLERNDKNFVSKKR
ncbi:hypothetical protein ACNQ13_00900 [Mycoplasma sp. VS428]|uniref:hypothetical protein n=1 Tax=Mycoplasma sp. VS428 TaxID=3401684 RepID=UPI003AAD0BA9